MTSGGTVIRGGTGPRLVQATCVLVGRTAVLIRGRPGSGKSSLAAGLLRHAGSRVCIRLVADDAVYLRPVEGRLVAVCPEPVSGLVELRGLGPMPAVAIDRAVVSAVVDLVAEELVDRLPEPMSAALLGVALPRLALPERGRLNPTLFLAWFDRLGSASKTAARDLPHAALPHHSIRA